MCLAQGPQRRDAQTCGPSVVVKHATTEPLRSHFHCFVYKNQIVLVSWPMNVIASMLD